MKNDTKQILELLEKIWSKRQSLRFNQLIHNLQHQFFHETGKGVLCHDYVKNESNGALIPMDNAVDLFNVEDDEFYQFLCKVIEKDKKSDEIRNSNPNYMKLPKGVTFSELKMKESGHKLSDFE